MFGWIEQKKALNFRYGKKKNACSVAETTFGKITKISRPK